MSHGCEECDYTGTNLRHTELPCRFCLSEGNPIRGFVLAALLSIIFWSAATCVILWRVK
jgi:hypothetical protein